ncbi:hypothetical protein OV207_27940 [Corallococcus sp. BB11-1]|uniref:hypothetical protein n=1 Tax=Corallococcus sp. BB11-1 TaxID=2996783 RepID=UPI00226E7FF2|nr:hypothetical protein [Corallococcus sp. BB11-1]MCY1035310.1 hypothetical protein [Corallococcus sp. BB11-1]
MDVAKENAMRWASFLTVLALLPGLAYASEFVGPIGAGAEGLRFSAGTASPRVAVAVAKSTSCQGPWYAYENADTGLGRLWTATLTEAQAQGRHVRIVGNGVCDASGAEGVLFVEQHGAGSTHVCARGGAAPMISLDANHMRTGQSPGRKLMGYKLRVHQEALLILVDDAPDLQPNQIRLEVDLDADGARRGKAIEAWSFCQGSRTGLIETSMQGGFGVGVICNPISPANNFRSGCTNTQSMVIQQDTTSELWLRRRDWAGVWHYAEGIDSTLWKAFGGRSLRFIWLTD